MCDHVSLKGFEPHEGFPTFRTFIGFLSVVSSFMIFKALEVAEGSPTYATFIWLLSVFLILRELVSSVTSGVPVMG